MDKLNKEFLQRNILSEQITAPNLNWDQLPEKVLQFGTGILLRGLPDFFIDQANRQGIFNGRIVVVKSTDKGGTDEFLKQNSLYTLHTKGIENGVEIQQSTIISSISKVLSASSQWNAILDTALSEDLEIIISNTTEVGIVLNPRDDLQASPPASFPGKLTALLYKRFLHFKGDLAKGLVILPTELVSDNGSKLKSIVLELSEINNLGAEFSKWLDDANYFCNTLVDRIVPGSLPKEDQRVAERALGFKDELAIMAEPFRLWAIEAKDEKVFSSLSFAKADEGVILTSDIHKYKELKLRLLNGSHTFLCALAILGGFKTVKEVMADPDFSGYTKGLMKEIIEAVEGDTVSRAEAKSFAEKVIDRFSNPFLNHQWKSISLNYTDKMQMRNVEMITSFTRKKQSVPEYMALGFAAYLLFTKDQLADGDPHALPISEMWKDDNLDIFIDKVLKDQGIWKTDLTMVPGFPLAVKKYFHSLMSLDVLRVIRQLNKTNNIVTTNKRSK